MFALRKQGSVAEWLGRGLQNLVQRFESARYLPLPALTFPKVRAFCLHIIAFPVACRAVGIFAFCKQLLPSRQYLIWFPAFAFKGLLFLILLWVLT
jgi:hypothetical protein